MRRSVEIDWNGATHRLCTTRSAYLRDMEERLQIADILAQPGRVWTHRPGALEAAVERVATADPCCLPAPILGLLRYSNGGEGELALPPRLFVFDGAQRP
jgi:hypothetical protein